MKVRHERFFHWTFLAFLQLTSRLLMKCIVGIFDCFMHFWSLSMRCYSLSISAYPIAHGCICLHCFFPKPPTCSGYSMIEKNFSHISLKLINLSVNDSQGFISYLLLTVIRGTEIGCLYNHCARNNFACTVIAIISLHWFISCSVVDSNAETLLLAVIHSGPKTTS